MDRIRNLRVARAVTWASFTLEAGFTAVNVIAAFTYGLDKVWPNIIVTVIMACLSGLALWALGALNPPFWMGNPKSEVHEGTVTTDAPPYVPNDDV